ncbi:iron-siderophore ABC transporter substrate-binding protein [Macrococcus brunensis]|uniref:Iron-siderophore ABC transporter substrate-binding protein n=1 Tax=Macrococcus brunensis TaxID=198483 RepID=A0A4R6BBM8_9STAP|nr:iron-siderophore ABC transporter substrate-binding protein [Macrococcus brunensis]TDL95228.1 iron-siderophore ABC transporter substrate-binding protein [Macrococcus brunensis]
MKKLWVLMIALLVLAACQNETTKESKEEGKTHTVKHAMGTTEVPDAPKRVVVLTNEGTEAVVSMGIQPVGAANSYEGKPWYPHLADKYKDIEPVGMESELNLERIAKLKPDLIIGNKFRQEAQYKKLSAIAPTVFSEELRSDWQENFKLYAKALNKVDEGNKVLADYDKHVNEAKKELGDKLNSKISMVRFMPGDVRMYQKDTFSGNILNQLGFKRPKAQDVDDFAVRNMTKEQIPEMDGDYLFYFTFMDGQKEVTALEKDWINDAAFKNLTAAKNNKVIKVDDGIWNTSGGVMSANMMIDDLKAKVLEK